MGRALAINEARPREDRGRGNSHGNSGGYDRDRKSNNRGHRNRRD